MTYIIGVLNKRDVLLKGGGDINECYEGDRAYCTICYLP